MQPCGDGRSPANFAVLAVPGPGGAQVSPIRVLDAAFFTHKWQQRCLALSKTTGGVFCLEPAMQNHLLNVKTPNLPETLTRSRELLRLYSEFEVRQSFPETNVLS